MTFSTVRHVPTLCLDKGGGGYARAVKYTTGAIHEADKCVCSFIPSGKAASVREHGYHDLHSQHSAPHTVHLQTLSHPAQPKPRMLHKGRWSPVQCTRCPVPWVLCDVLLLMAVVCVSREWGPRSAG